MIKRRSTITQSYSPSFRRRTPNLLFATNADFDPYITWEVQHQTENNQQIKNDKRIEKIEQIFQNSVEHHKKIGQIIDEVDNIIKKRMEAHEEGLLSVVRSQIDKMQSQCKKIVHEYNRMIQQKNKESEIYSLKNELQYFRETAFNYFEENKRLTSENKELKSLTKVKDSIIEELNEVIKRNTKKILRQKSISDKKQREFMESDTFSKIEKKMTKSKFDIAEKAKVNQQSVNTCKQELLPIDSTKDFIRAKLAEKSINSNRYHMKNSNERTNYNSTITQNRVPKRLHTDMGLTSIKKFQSFSQKKKVSEKSKSFWKFQSFT